MKDITCDLASLLVVFILISLFSLHRTADSTQFNGQARASDSEARFLEAICSTGIK